MKRWRRLPPRVRHAVLASALSVAFVLFALGFLVYLVYRSKASAAACSRHPGCFNEDPTGAYVMILGTPLLVLLLWQLSATFALTRGRGLASGTMVSLVWIGIDVLTRIYSPRSAGYTTLMAVLNVAVIVLLWRARSALRLPATPPATS